MIKTLLLAAIVIFIATAAGAQTRNFYDARANKLGSATTINNTTVFYDRDGNRTGSAVVSPSGVTTFYDKLSKREVTISGALSLGRSR